MSERHWSVEVKVDGQSVLTIESSCLSGVENVSDFKREILDAAENLRAFIGSDDSQDFEGLLREVDSENQA